MEELEILAVKAKCEGEDNRRRAAHNAVCAVEDSEPYDNAAWLEYAGYLRRRIKAAQEARNQP